MSKLGHGVTDFPQAHAPGPLSDHRLAWTGYIASHGPGAIADGDSLVTVAAGLPVLRATFDAQSWLTQLEARIEGESDQP